MRNLIIGCGYLGLRVAALWHEQGHEVLATTRHPTRFADLRAQGIEPILCDVLDPGSLHALPSVDNVVYAVAPDRTSGQSMRDVYVKGLQNVLDHLPRPGRFIYVSSASVYGQSTGDWVDEDSTTEPEEEAGKIVLDAERLLRQKLPGAIILRFAGIYGPGRLLRQKTIEAGEPIVGDADKWLNLIHVEDGTRAVLAAVERGQPGSIINVCDGQPVRRRDFYRELARLLGAAPPRFVPPPPGAAIRSHEKGNRRLGNRRLLEELQVTLAYPCFREGLACAVSGK